MKSGIESEWVPDEKSRICSAHFINNKKSEDPRSPSYHPSIFPEIYHRTKVPQKAANNRYKLQLKLCNGPNKSKALCNKKSAKTESTYNYNTDDVVAKNCYQNTKISIPVLFKDVSIQQDFLEENSENILNIFICNRYISSTICDAEVQAWLPLPKKKQSQNSLPRNKPSFLEINIKGEPELQGLKSENNT